MLQTEELCPSYSSGLNEGHLIDFEYFNEYSEQQCV